MVNYTIALKTSVHSRPCHLHSNNQTKQFIQPNLVSLSSTNLSVEGASKGENWEGGAANTFFLIIAYHNYHFKYVYQLNCSGYWFEYVKNNYSLMTFSLCKTSETRETLIQTLGGGIEL